MKLVRNAPSMITYAQLGLTIHYDHDHDYVTFSSTFKVVCFLHFNFMNDFCMLLMMEYCSFQDVLPCKI